VRDRRAGHRLPDDLHLVPPPAVDRRFVHAGARGDRLDADVGVVALRQFLDRCGQDRRRVLGGATAGPGCPCCFHSNILSQLTVAIMT
jgi:hypothetical protein